MNIILQALGENRVIGVIGSFWCPNPSADKNPLMTEPLVNSVLAQLMYKTFLAQRRFLGSSLTTAKGFNMFAATI